MRSDETTAENRRGEIVAAAMVLLERHGLAGFSMRLLGRQLGIQPSAIYWHFDDKQSLLAAVADQILAMMPAASRQESPEAAARHFRDALLSIADGAEIVLSTIALGLGAAQVQTRFLTAFENAGYSLKDARTRADTMLHFALGHVLHAQQRSQAEQLGVALSAPTIAADAESFRAGICIICH